MSKRKNPGRPPTGARHRTRTLAVLILSAVGVALTVWLVGIHLTLKADPSASSACNFGGYLNCDVVNASRYATVFGVPIAYGGLALYLLLAGLAIFELRGAPPRTLAYARGLGALAVFYSLWLAFVSGVILGAFCLFCVGLYLVNLGLAGLGWWNPPTPRPRFFFTLDRDLRRLFKGPGAWVARAGLLLLLAGAIGVGALSASLGGAVETRQVEVGGRTLSAARGHADGPVDAPLTVVVFSDFECPYCERASVTFDTLRERFEGQVRFVYKHFPLDPACNPATPMGAHDRACAAADAAVCAGQQGGFWAYHQAVFEKGVTERALLDAATEVGLDLDAFKQCRYAPGAREAVRADVDDGIRVGLTSTPTFLVGDRLVLGARPVDELDGMIRAALSRAGSQGGAATTLPAAEQTDG